MLGGFFCLAKAQRREGVVCLVLGVVGEGSKGVICLVLEVVGKKRELFLCE